MTDLKPRDTDPFSEDDADGKLAEAIARIAAQGYPGHFVVTVGRVWCASCRSHVGTDDIRWQVTEVVPGPDQVTVVGGIRCPICDERGTASTAIDLAAD